MEEVFVQGYRESIWSASDVNSGKPDSKTYDLPQIPQSEVCFLSPIYVTHISFY